MKAPKTKGVADAKTQRLNVRVTSAAYERLLIHGIKTRRSPGDLVTDLIERHLREWSMPGDLTTRGQSRGSARDEGQREDSEPVAA